MAASIPGAQYISTKFLASTSSAKITENNKPVKRWGRLPLFTSCRETLFGKQLNRVSRVFW